MIYSKNKSRCKTLKLNLSMKFHCIMEIHKKFNNVNKKFNYNKNKLSKN